MSPVLRRLFRVESTLRVGIPAHCVIRSANGVWVTGLKAGDALEIHDPDGGVRQVKIASVDVHRPGAQIRTAVHLHPQVKLDRTVRGAEVWTDIERVKVVNVSLLGELERALDTDFDAWDGWAAVVQPSFHKWAALAHDREKSRALFVTEPETPDAWSHAQPVDVAGWTDPVDEQLKRGVMLHRETAERVARDGIGYALRTRHADVSAQLEFANPRRPSFVALQHALVLAAREISRRQSDRPSAAYLDVWAKYLGDGLH